MLRRDTTMGGWANPQLRDRHELAATAYFPSKSALNGPVTVRLQPCGQAKARLVNSAGKPVARSLATPTGHT